MLLLYIRRCWNANALLIYNSFQGDHRLQDDHKDRSIGIKLSLEERQEAGWSVGARVVG